MTTTSLRTAMAQGQMLAGTFVKTPHHVIIEVLAHAGLDFLCLDAEHAPFDRSATDACLAVARGLNLPILIRVPSAAPADILNALDLGATGIVVPHVDSVDKARAVARAARFGHHGRGYAGSTRWAGYATRTMADVLAQSRNETIVIAQIEEPEGVQAAAEIAAIEGIDGLFVGPADLSVAFGQTDTTGPELQEAMAEVGAACAAHGKTYMTWVANAAQAQDWRRHGFTMFFVASEHAWMLKGARDTAQGIHGLE